jgi:hypothetical protein
VFVQLNFISVLPFEMDDRSSVVTQRIALGVRQSSCFESGK